MRVLIDGQPFQFQPPNNGTSVRRLCRGLVSAGFKLKPRIARAQTEAVPRDVESQTMTLLRDRTQTGRLALIAWLVDGEVVLASPDDTNGHSPKLPPGVLVNRGSNTLFIGLPPRDRSGTLFMLLELLEVSRFRLNPQISALRSNPRHNWFQQTDARFRRCTRPEVLVSILREVLAPGCHIEVATPEAISGRQVLGTIGHNGSEVVPIAT